MGIGCMSIILLFLIVVKLTFLLFCTQYRRQKYPCPMYTDLPPIYHVIHSMLDLFFLQNLSIHPFVRYFCMILFLSMLGQLLIIWTFRAHQFLTTLWPSRILFFCNLSQTILHRLSYLFDVKTHIASKLIYGD